MNDDTKIRGHFLFSKRFLKIFLNFFTPINKKEVDGEILNKKICENFLKIVWKIVCGGLSLYYYSHKQKLHYV